MASTVPGSCTLTAVETAEHWAEQSVCTSLNENAVTHSVLLGSKNVRKGCALILILMGPCFLTIFATSNIERARAFPSFFHGQSIHCAQIWLF